MMDSQVDLKLIGLWQITKIPNLKAELVGDSMNFSWSHIKKQFEILKLPNAIFLSLEPIELRAFLEKAIQEKQGIDAKIWRSDLSHFRKDPFSSQN